MALRRAHLEISHQLETSHEEIRGLSLRLQENVSGDGKVELYKTHKTHLLVQFNMTLFFNTRKSKIEIKLLQKLLKNSLIKKKGQNRSNQQ